MKLNIIQSMLSKSEFFGFLQDGWNGGCHINMPIGGGENTAAIVKLRIRPKSGSVSFGSTLGRSQPDFRISGRTVRVASQTGSARNRLWKEIRWKWNHSSGCGLQSAERTGTNWICWIFESFCSSLSLFVFRERSRDITRDRGRPWLWSKDLIEISFPTQPSFASIPPKFTKFRIPKMDPKWMCCSALGTLVNLKHV